MTISQNWFIYIVSCSDGTLYTGITTDLERRIAEHNSNIGGAKYTRSRNPVKLIFSERVRSRSAAGKREHQIKKMTLAKKLEIIEQSNDKQSK